MGKNRKRFIDKKASATFVLMHRESRDGDDGGERVLTRVDDNDDVKVPGILDEVGATGEVEEGAESRVMNESTRAELLQMGFPDDGYNYMAHLRSIGTGPGQGYFVPAAKPQLRALPEDVKAYDASHEDDKRDAALLRSRNAATRGLDPEVAAALDAIDASEDELEDDFVLVANKDAPGKCPSPAFDSDDEHSVDIENADEGATGFLDEQFEVLALNEYDDDDSELDDDDPRAKGFADISDFSSVLDDFLAQGSTVYKTPASLSEPAVIVKKEVTQNVETSTATVCVEEYEESDHSEHLEDVCVESDEDKWDCDTIISTLCNSANHPATITAPSTGRVKLSSIVQPADPRIRIGGKQKLPLDFVPSNKAAEAVKEGRSTHTVNMVRQRNVETPEQRKARKAAVKLLKRASREAKKEVKLKYKQEAQKAQLGAAVSGPRAIHLP